ncbi:MAG: methyltransferase domain-containing protein [Microlunatus sp.]
MPWDHCEPTPILVDWLTGRCPDARSSGSRAIVVGCGYGNDAEFVASLGFTTTAFDISETAVKTARKRHEHTDVDYQQADLLALPNSWLRGFDLVVESTTLQCLPPDLHNQAAAAVAALCAPGGTVLVIARQPSSSDPPAPPWLLSETEVGWVASDGVELVRLDTVSMNGGPRWVAEFHRLA